MSPHLFDTNQFNDKTFLGGFMTRYTGPLHVNVKYMTKRAMRAYKCWLQQNQRCTNPNNPKFRYYGGKGIVVEYSSRDFVSWYLSEWKRLGIKKPSIGRVDHNKNYCFNNVILESVSDNSKENVKRNGLPSDHVKRSVLSYDLKTGQILNKYSSLTDAAEASGVSPQRVYYACKRYGAKRIRNRSPVREFSFKYAEDN